MTGKTSLRRVKLPYNAGDAAEKKFDLGMKHAVVPIVGSRSEVVVKYGAVDTDYAGKAQLVIRRMGRGGPTETSGRAKALKLCKGKRGSEFKTCAKGALGTLGWRMEHPGVKREETE